MASRWPSSCRSRPRLRLLVVAAAVLVFVFPVGARAGWSAPTIVSGTGGAVPAVAINERDDVLVAWESFAPFLFPEKAPPTVGVSFRPRHGGFTPPNVIDAQGATAPSVAVSDTGEGVLGWESKDSLSDSTPEVVVAMVGRDGRAGLRRRFAGAGIDVAADRDGTAIAVWAGAAGIHASWRAPGAAAFGPELVLARGAAGYPNVAFAEGRAIVTWAAMTGTGTAAVLAAAAAPGAASGVQAVATGEDSVPAEVGIRTNRRGDALLFWRGNGAIGAASPVKAAVRRPGELFGPAQRLSVPGGMTGQPAAGLDPYGNAWVWWGDANPALSDNAHLARRERRFRSLPKPPPPALGPPLPVEALGADAAGNFISILPGRDFKSIVAGIRTPEGVFAPPQLVAPSQPGPDANPGPVVFNERGTGAATWAQGGRTHVSLYDGVQLLRQSLPRISRFGYLRPRGRRSRPAFRVRTSKRLRIQVKIDAMRRCRHRPRGPRSCTVVKLTRWLNPRMSRLLPDRRATRKLARPGRYRATITGEDTVGRLANPRSIRFRVPKQRRS
jgi:hypothetical protein